MADVFKRTELKFGGAFAADKGLITPNKGLSGIMMQSINLNYSQNVTRMYEIGSTAADPNVYYIGGRSQGTMQAAHVIGPKVAMKTYYENFSDVCEAETNDIELKLTKAECKSGGAARSISYKAKYCVLIQIGMSVSAQDLVINENSQLMFSNLEYTET